jgi:Condensin complex subunit 2
MSDVLGSLYGNHSVDAENVSVHSAFICLLHIANEKGLALETERETDLRIFKAVK